METEICTKMLKKLSEKLRAKFPATTPGYSMVKISRLNAFPSRSFVTASKPSRRSITTAKRKENEKKERQKILKSKSLKMKVTFLSKNSKFSLLRTPKPKCHKT